MKHLLNKTFMIIFVSFLSSMANAQNWVKFSESPEADFYIDESSIRRSGSIATYWGMHNRNLAGLVTQPTNAYSTKYKGMENCDTEESKPTYFVDYEKPMGEGKVLKTVSWDEKATPNIPGSIGYMVMKYVCNSKRNKK